MFAEGKTVSSECVQKMNEPIVQLPCHPGLPKCGSDRSTSEAESGDEEKECEEEYEDTADFRAPIELLAEVRHYYTHHVVSVHILRSC